jgi:hypothetical protein
MEEKSKLSSDDLAKHIYMNMTLYLLQHFIPKEEQTRTLFRSYPVVHKVYSSTYGEIIETDIGLIFRKSKGGINYTCKIVSQDDIDRNFRKSNPVEICHLEMMETK